MNRTLIFYVYWNYANLCYIRDTLRNTDGTKIQDGQDDQRLMRSQMSLYDSEYSLNDPNTEDVRKFVPKEYNMSLLSELDKAEVEPRESFHTSENFQGLLLELFSKGNFDSVHSTATLNSSQTFNRTAMSARRL